MWDHWTGNIYNRLHPNEGWLPLLLLAGAVALFAITVLETGWVAEDGLVIPTAVTGLLLGALLAKRPLTSLAAWIILILYALLIPLIWLTNLRPPWTILAGGWEPVRQYWLDNGAIFWDRLGSWLLAVTGGGSSSETIVFALLLGITVFLASAYASWATFRQQRPLPALFLLGLLIAINAFYGNVQIWWPPFFVGLAALLIAVINFARLEKEWSQEQVDYAAEIRLELTGYAAMLAVFLLSFALLLPTFSITRLQTWFYNLTAVTQVEDTLGRAFAGIEPPAQPGNRSGLPNPAWRMPRDYLLGNAPELYETVVLTAVVTTEIDNTTYLAPPELLAGVHWRALSYDVYTGRGWRISEERRDPTSAQEEISHSPATNQVVVQQLVDGLSNRQAIRYNLGLPRQYDHVTVLSWRGLDDFVRAWGGNGRYQVISSFSNATPAQLQQARLEDVPAPILARYTQLPDSLPQRVSDLAQQIAGELDSPYDQARALEQFLRQYPYSLEIPPPSNNDDPVDYFLFEAQTGYCDYYASSMVVMARTLGLPARMAIGYLSQPPNADGQQIIRQIDGHSWAEVYFAGYGWVEFEPTAPFPSALDQRVTYSNGAWSSVPYYQPENEATPPPPLPLPQRPQRYLWPILLTAAGVLMLALVWGRKRRRERPLRADEVTWAYYQLQNYAASVNNPPQPSQTPQEFAQGLLTYLEEQGSSPAQQRRIEQIRPFIHTITRLFILRRYARATAGGKEEAKRAWIQLRRPFLRYRLRYKLRRQPAPPPSDDAPKE
jgi:transglutaminase-like putative cysteine protease